MKTRKYWALRDPDGFLGAMRPERDSTDYAAYTGRNGAWRNATVVPVVPIVVDPRSSRLLVQLVAASIRSVIDCGDDGIKLSLAAAKQVMKDLDLPIGGRK